MATTDNPRRRWFQFHLRTLLIAVAVLAVPMAWVGYSLRWIAERRAALGLAFVEANANAPGGLWLLGERGLSKIGISDYDTNHERLELLYPEAEVVPSGEMIEMRIDSKTGNFLPWPDRRRNRRE